MPVAEVEGEDEEDEVPKLPTDTLDALQAFYNEKDAHEKHFEDLKAKAESEAADHDISIEAFAEDWNASQFWYKDETAIALAQALLSDATSESWIAIISAPSVFVQIRKLLAVQELSSRPRIRLLEYDERFSVFREFVKYDFAEPFRLPVDLKGRFTHMICDPPFLSQDCQTRVALTARWLSSDDLSPKPRTIVCTGAVMQPLIEKLYSKEGVLPTDFEPKHSKGLSNEFRCYSNFESKDWRFVA